MRRRGVLVINITYIAHVLEIARLKGNDKKVTLSSCFFQVILK